MTEYSITLGQLAHHFELEKIVALDDWEDILLHSKNINRPGIQLAGFYENFAPSRIQVIGETELAYINHHGGLGLAEFFKRQPVLIIISRELSLPPLMIELARENNVPLFKTPDITSEIVASLTSYMHEQLAERIVTHGVFVEVLGEGVLIIGESGVGKSETAAELIMRGHRLIADDAVELRRVSRTTVLGTSPENIRHFLELRGIGIINAKKLFGISAVKITEKVDFIIELEIWNKNAEYDRIGLDERYKEFLGVDIPSILIPVNPGRNLAIIVEMAAMNHRQKKMGYHSAKDLIERLKF